MIINLQIEGMSCEHCVRRVENALKEVAGVSNVVVTLDTNSAEVTASNVDEKLLLEAIEEAGYKGEIK